MEEEQIVRSLVDRINVRDFEALGEVVDDEVVVHYNSGPAVAGLAGLEELLGDLDRVVLAHDQSVTVTVENLVALEGRVGFRYTLRGGAEVGIDAITVGGAAICELSAGKITTMWAVTDRSSFESQMAALSGRT